MKSMNFLAIILFFIPNFISAQELINQFDESKKYHGKWVRYYPESRAKRYEGYFIHGKPSGEFTYYYNTGNVRMKMNYEDSGRVAYTTSYFDNGAIYTEGKYIDKQKEGLWKFYDGYGNVIATQEYSKGKKHGTELTYLQNGILLEEKEYLNGNLHGKWNRYFSNGKSHFTGGFKDNMWSGEFVFFHLNGKKSVSGSYENSLKQGDWKYWDTNGILIKVVNFKNSNIISSKVFQIEKDQDWIDQQDIETIMRIIETKQPEKSSFEFPYEY
jgi:antitoxin component YwqK of YwqJK toxin-antitoxin module